MFPFVKTIELHIMHLTPEDYKLQHLSLDFLTSKLLIKESQKDRMVELCRLLVKNTFSHLFFTTFIKILYNAKEHNHLLQRLILKMKVKINK